MALKIANMILVNKNLDMRVAFATKISITIRKGLGEKGASNLFYWIKVITTQSEGNFIQRGL